MKRIKLFENFENSSTYVSDSAPVRHAFRDSLPMDDIKKILHKFYSKNGDPKEMVSKWASDYERKDALKYLHRIGRLTNINNLKFWIEHTTKSKNKEDLYKFLDNITGNFPGEQLEIEY
jgi:hypothetical protein